MSDLEPPSTATSPAEERAVEPQSVTPLAVDEVLGGTPEEIATDNAREVLAPDTNFIYAIGRIEPRFPSPGVEKEFAQATGRAETAGLTDREALHKVLTNGDNRYLVRQLVWVLTIEGLETYIVTPRDPTDFDLLINALRSAPRADDIDVVIGIQGPIAPAEI